MLESLCVCVFTCMNACMHACACACVCACVCVRVDSLCWWSSSDVKNIFKKNLCWGQMLRRQEVDRAHAEGHCHLETAGLLDLSLRHFDNDDAMSLVWGESSFVFWN